MSTSSVYKEDTPKCNGVQVVSFAVPGGLIVGESPQTVNYGEGGSAVGAFADTGAEFRKWSDGVTDNPRTDHNVTGDIEVTALFQSVGGVPIEWYDQYGLAPSGDEAWSDLDDRDEYNKGMTLREEYVADTIPTESTSVFRVVEMEVGPPVTIAVDPSSPGRVYTLRYSEDLVNWRDVTDQIAVPGGTEPLTDPAHPESNHFHKVIVEVPPVSWGRPSASSSEFASRTAATFTSNFRFSPARG